LPSEILPGDSVRLVGEAAPGARVRVLVNDATVASAVAGDQGGWRASLGFAQPGTYTVTLQVVDEAGSVLAAAEPVTLVVLEPTPTEAPTEAPTATTVVTPTVTMTETAEVAEAPAVMTETVGITATATISPGQPAALPGTGVAMDKLGLYNILIPLALVIGLFTVTALQRKRKR
jgi:hypothetical protein